MVPNIQNWFWEVGSETSHIEGYSTWHYLEVLLKNCYPFLNTILALSLYLASWRQSPAGKPLHSSQLEVDRSPPGATGKRLIHPLLSLLLRMCHPEIETHGHTKGNDKASVRCNVYDPETTVNGHLAWFTLLTNVVLARSESESSHRAVVSSAGFEQDAPSVSSMFYPPDFYHCTARCLAEDRLWLKT